MPRYIDADRFDILTFHRHSEDFMDGMDFILEMIDKAPTEDVVPRSEVEKAKQEVAREIFDVLDKKKRYLMKSNNYNLFKASIDFFDHIDDFVGLTGEEILAKIEKKYIGDTTDGGVSSEYNFETGF